MRIGELAELAGVSTRAVRHYHHLGLLPEPRRLANGYRAYGLRDAVVLARVRRLTELGLSLDEVRDVLADDAGRELREVLEELDAGLARQEEAIRARRERLAALLRRADGEGLPAESPVSEELAALFAATARTAEEPPGPPSPLAAKDRELLALLETNAPPGTRDRMYGMYEALRSLATAPGASGRIHETYALLDALADAAPDDPRVAEAARAVVACLPPDVVSGLPYAAEGAGPAAEPFLAAFLADFAPAQAEALRRAFRALAEGDA
ncbi:MerR family transcriptional regulator [Streptomyces sp. UNOC14_S4]|uniref:MerR family transcriptional regulator n=1 Tax=Streptomyces sp. UNOC14_S4 TaxID=2872340 RepID=UPI001E34C492|nr:MerR family transcriptional regulator [Streptomyces sp. UNOC14_S4]MCC3772505.1 MerR family transcriptional regulator [Streptomyces sp. UNOC14_S4]